MYHVRQSSTLLAIHVSAAVRVSPCIVWSPSVVHAVVVLHLYRTTPCGQHLHYHYEGSSWYCTWRATPCLCVCSMTCSVQRYSVELRGIQYLIRTVLRCTCILLSVRRSLSVCSSVVTSSSCTPQIDIVVKYSVVLTCEQRGLLGCILLVVYTCSCGRSTDVIGWMV